MLYYRAELNGNTDTTRAEYNDRAKTLHSDLTKKLTHSGHFITAHLDRTIDPYIALDEANPEVSLSEFDERIRDRAGDLKRRHPWPAGTEYDIEELSADFPTPSAAQRARRNVVTYEVRLQGTSDVSDGWGSPAPLEQGRRLRDEFVAESETVSSIKRFRPIEDGWYAFRFRNDEVRVRATAKAERTYIEWKIGYTDGCPRGLGWAGVLTDDQHGLSNGRLYLDKHSNDTGQTYFKDSLHSIPMPKEIAESLIEDARTTEPHQLQALSES